MSGNAVSSFGTGGVLLVAPATAFNQLEAIDIQADGKILATGFCQDHPYDIGIVRIVSTTLSTDDVADEKETMVYPNPTSGILNIQSPAKVFTDIKLLDITGKVLTPINRSSNQIDLSHYPAGLYFLTVGNNEFREVHKIVKE